MSILLSRSKFHFQKIYIDKVTYGLVCYSHFRKSPGVFILFTCKWKFFYLFVFRYFVAVRMHFGIKLFCLLLNFSPLFLRNVQNFLYLFCLCRFNITFVLKSCVKFRSKFCYLRQWNSSVSLFSISSEVRSASCLASKYVIIASRDFKIKTNKMTPMC